MKNKWTRLLLIGIAIVSLTLSACGGGGDSGGDSGSRIIIGQFKNNYVEGLRYECFKYPKTGSPDLTNPSMWGHTDKDGRFKCPSNSMINFYIGNFFIGGTTSTVMLTPRDFNSPGVISQILQSINENENITDGIKISERFDLLDDFPFHSYETSEEGFYNELKNRLEKGGYELIDEEVALKRLNNSLDIPWSSYLENAFENNKDFIFYSVFKEKGVVHNIKFELRKGGQAIATYKSKTETGFFNLQYFDVNSLFIGHFKSFPDSVYKIIADQGHRLVVDLSESDSWWDLEREHLYFNLDDVSKDIDNGWL